MNKYYHHLSHSNCVGFGKYATPFFSIRRIFGAIFLCNCNTNTSFLRKVMVTLIFIVRRNKQKNNEMAQQHVFHHLKVKCLYNSLVSNKWEFSRQTPGQSIHCYVIDECLAFVATHTRTQWMFLLFFLSSSSLWDGNFRRMMKLLHTWAKWNITARVDKCSYEIDAH